MGRTLINQIDIYVIHAQQFSRANGKHILLQLTDSLKFVVLGIEQQTGGAF